jgi:starvation-inducible outer membrane lipoprotein
MVTPLNFPPPALRVLAIALAAVLAACSTAPEHPASDNAAVQAEAAREVRRICALPEDQRQAEIRRTRDQSGVVIGCGGPR